MPAAKSQNIDWISNLRVIALYAVIILHCSSPLLLSYGKVPMADWWQADFLNALVRFAVPVFVMITGALLLHREYEIGDFLKKRLGRVVWPFLFWSLVYVAYAWYNGDITFTNDIWADVRQVLRQLKSGAAYHLWYVYMLIGLYFFIPVIGKFVRNASEKEILYFLIVWFGVMLITQPYLSRYNPAVDMHYFAGYAGYLVLGHYLAFKEFKIKYIAGWAILAFVCGVVLIAVGSKMVLSYPKYPGTMFYEPVNPAVVLISSGIFLFIKYTVPKLPPIVTTARDFVGKYSYEIYLAHALILFLLDDQLNISYKLCTPVISIPLTAFIALALSLLLVWILDMLLLVAKWLWYKTALLSKLNKQAG